MLDLSNLSPSPGARKKRKRVGRGPSSGHGKTSGRGANGQKSRSGYSRRFGFEGGQTPLNRRLPKRGFHHSDRHEMAAVNLDVLNEHFEDGAEVTSQLLAEQNLVKDLPGGVKILGRGEITKKLTLKVNGISESARQKVEAAGGSVELSEAPVARAVKNRSKGKKTEQ
jgi:large subunit ribosomal protein L15